MSKLRKAPGHMLRVRAGASWTEVVCRKCTLHDACMKRTPRLTARSSLCRSNSHNWNFKPGFYAINERFEPANGAVMQEGQAFVDKIALYHYVVKCVSSPACDERASVMASEAKADLSASSGSGSGSDQGQCTPWRASCGAAWETSSGVWCCGPLRLLWMHTLVSQG